MADISYSKCQFGCQFAGYVWQFPESKPRDAVQTFCHFSVNIHLQAAAAERPNLKSLENRKPEPQTTASRV